MCRRLGVGARTGMGSGKCSLVMGQGFVMSICCMGLLVLTMLVVSVSRVKLSSQIDDSGVACVEFVFDVFQELFDRPQGSLLMLQPFFTYLEPLSVLLGLPPPPAFI